MVRTPTSKSAYRNMWAQIGTSACVLLLPPLAVGAAVYVMHPSHDDGVTAAPHVVADVPPAATPIQSSAYAPTIAPAPAYSLASAHQEPSGKDNSRVLSPTPVHVTVVVAPQAATEGAAPKAPTVQLEPTAPVQAAVTAPAQGPVVAPAPAAVAKSSQSMRHAAPQTAPAAVPPAAAVAPLAALAPEELADLPAEETGTIQTEARTEQPTRASAAARHYRVAYVRRLARRTTFVRSEAHAARWSATQNRGSWLQNFLGQLGGSRPRTPQRS